MPISIVKDVIKRCNSRKLRSWEVNLKKERKLSCRSLGEAVASIVATKIKKQGKFNQSTDWEMYQSLSYIDPIEVKEIFMQYGGGSSDKKKKRKNSLFELKEKEVFAAGKWKGDDYTESDLDEMVRAFEELDFKPALKIHHEPNGENKDVSFLNPALGKISRLYRKGKKLLADFCDVPKRVHDAVVNRAYDRVSSEIAWNFERCGKKFKRVLTAVSLLGSDIPAVANLDQLNELYGIDLGNILEYEDNNNIKTYDLANDCEDDVIEFGGPLDWEDTPESYIYWMNKFDPINNQIDNVEKEDLGDGVNKLFKTREIINDNLETEDIKDIVGWEFKKSDFNLAQAKAWIHKRKEPNLHPFNETKKIEEDTPKSAGSFNNDEQKEEEKMADEKLKEELAALQVKLADFENKIKELNDSKAEFEAKNSESEEQKKKFSEKKVEFEAKLKEDETKIKELNDEKTKLVTENKEFAEKEAQAREKAQSLEIQKFIDEKIGQGKLLPRSKELAESLLSIADDGEKVCKYSYNKEKKESTIVETFKDFIESMPRLVDFNQLSKQDEEEDTGDFDFAVKAKIKESGDKLNYIEAAKIVTKENGKLFDEYQTSMFKSAQVSN